ncbi:DUF296 domain-containing protein [Nostoc parmelioides FACHB-3921]|uniref:DUF296 domain-containing protein n=1 Tax=Nostoc parmelioides FACHB-3921 TaxID=2692909 RepID=A0ABR8BLR4_9NOSO|nr:DUF296 domain-containing protein [Nostoc parmelioides FACHB-3921]
MLSWSEIPGLARCSSTPRIPPRFANQEKSTTFDEKSEILALNGTLSNEGIHLHIALADQQGKTIGGHLVDGCIIYTTEEIIIGTTQDFCFGRRFDEQTGYQELDIQYLPLIDS